MRGVGGKPARGPSLAKKKFSHYRKFYIAAKGGQGDFSTKGYQVWGREGEKKTSAEED